MTRQHCTIPRRHMPRHPIFTMTGRSFVLLVLIALTNTASAIEGWLEPKDQPIKAGTTLTLNCTIDASKANGRTAQDIVWIDFFSWAPVSPDSYTAISDTVSQLALPNVTMSQQRRMYCCKFPGDGLSQFRDMCSLVDVGIKPEPGQLDCTLRSPGDFKCSWEEGTYTNLPTTHIFTYWADGSWQTCPPESERDDTCSLQVGATADTTHVRVNSSNVLGEAYAEMTLSLHEDVVVHPPRNVELAKLETETSLMITWDPPDELRGFKCLYKLRFMRDDCVLINNSCCCWTEISNVTSSGCRLAYILSWLDPYSVYRVQLAARYIRAREENWSDWSPVNSAHTREIAPTRAVQDLTASETSNPDDPVFKRDVHIFWTGLPEGQRNGLLLGYNITVEQDNPLATVYESNTESYRHRDDIDGLSKYFGYRVKVAAYNGAGSGPWSTVHIANLADVPSAPEEVKAVALTRTSILVTWMEPSQPNGFILYYVVEWGRTNDNKESYTTPNASQLSYLLEDLETFALYEISVKARNSRGDSDFASVNRGARTLEGVPDAAPANVEIRPVDAQPDRLVLMWQRLPAENVNGNLAGYLIWFCESSQYDHNSLRKNCSGKVRQQNLTQPDAVSTTLTGLKPSTQYFLWLAAYTLIGIGPESEPVQGKTVDETQWKLRLAILTPLAVLITIGTIGICTWLKCSHAACPATSKGVDLWKDRSKVKEVREEQIYQTVSSPKDAVTNGKLGDNSEVTKEAMQPSLNLDLLLESVILDSKTQTAKFTSSERRDSGVPQSPLSDCQDFGILGDKLNDTEEGDSIVFVKDVDGKNPTTESDKPT